MIIQEKYTRLGDYTGEIYKIGSLYRISLQDWVIIQEMFTRLGLYTGEVYKVG